MSETMEETEATPKQKARKIYFDEVGYLYKTIEGHKKHLDALGLAIELFGDEPGVWFGLRSSWALVSLTVDDVNESLRKIHHVMRTAGWEKDGTFNKESLSWDWKLDNASMHFSLSLSAISTCRKVQVDVREVPVYEIQCDGGGIEEPE